MSYMSEEHRELLEEKLAEEARWYRRGPSWEDDRPTNAYEYNDCEEEPYGNEPEDDDQGVQWDSGEEEDDEDQEDDDGEDLPNHFIADF